MKSKSKNKIKALVLFSGGLDSRLAVKLLQQQTDVEAVFFQLPFGGGCCNNFACVFNYSQAQGVKLHIVDLTKGKLFQNYLKIIKNPKHGTGTAINPCKDCKIFMFKKAKELAKKIKADVIATGEVLGQRPMSQLKKDLFLTEKESNLRGKLLRPLSAKLLPLTIAEKKKLIDRKKLLDIQGRSRKKQIQLAKKYKIKYPSAGGGCLLCEPAYSKKLSFLFKHKKQIKPEHLELLKSRLFYKNGLIILGKNQEQNSKLEFLNKKLNYHILIPKIPGPTALFENKKDLLLAEKLIKTYSTKDINLKKEFEKYQV